MALEDDLVRFFSVNVVGNINLINEYMPLILKGTAKKVISITSGFADADIISEYDFSGNPSYPISKAAMNMAMAKFSAEYREDGVLCMSIAPGVVATSGYEGDGKSPGPCPRSSTTATLYRQLTGLSRGSPCRDRHAGADGQARCVCAPFHGPGDGGAGRPGRYEGHQCVDRGEGLRRVCLSAWRQELDLRLPGAGRISLCWPTLIQR